MLVFFRIILIIFSYFYLDQLKSVTNKLINQPFTDYLQKRKYKHSVVVWDIQ